MNRGRLNGELLNISFCLPIKNTHLEMVKKRFSAKTASVGINGVI